MKKKFIITYHDTDSNNCIHITPEFEVFAEVIEEIMSKLFPNVKVDAPNDITNLSLFLELIPELNQGITNTVKILSIVSDKGDVIYNNEIKPNFYIKNWGVRSFEKVTGYYDGQPIFNKTISSIAQELFLYDLNVMMIHGKDSDYLFVDSGRFKQH